MLTNSRLLSFLLSVFFCQTAVVQAATFGTYDPRSLAMGGTGVSQANIDHAAYYNPALLSMAQDDDDFSLLIPTIGVRAYDPEKFLEALEDHQDGNYETVIQKSVDAFNSSPSASSAQQVVKDAQRLHDSLVALSGKELDLEVHAGLGIAIPSKTLGFAVTASGRAMAGVVVDITDDDQDLIQNFIDAANDYSDDGLFNNRSYPGTVVCTTPAPDHLCDPRDNISSTASILGAVIVEGGISLSHEFESLDNWAIGITPKTVRVHTFEYKDIAIEDAEIDEDKGKKQYDDTNIDIGVAKRLGESWKFGLVVRNAVEKEYQTVEGSIIKLEPTARMGISHHTNWTTVALDVDLTENERLGLTGEKTQYVALGMEFDVSILQLRIGARHNLSAEANREANILSAGLGLYLAGFHLDVGAAKNDEELAAAAQIGFQF